MTLSYLWTAPSQPPPWPSASSCHSLGPTPPSSCPTLKSRKQPWLPSSFTFTHNREIRLVASSPFPWLSRKCPNWSPVSSCCIPRDLILHTQLEGILLQILSGHLAFLSENCQWPLGHQKVGHTPQPRSRCLPSPLSALTTKPPINPPSLHLP